MLRLITFAVLGAAACGAPSKPSTVANAQASTRYTLQPIRLHGSEGRHSAWQSWTTTRGTLELAGSRATLTLESSTDHSPVYCPGGARTFGRQACAPRDATFSTTRFTRTLAGDARWKAGALTATLRGDHDSVIALHCKETFLGYACSYDDDGTLFPRPFPRPARFDFSAAAPRVLQLEPRSDSTGQPITGGLTIRPDATALVTLHVADKTFELPASIMRVPAGLAISGGPPTSSFTLICTDTDARLACDTTFDRSVLGQADHLTGPSVFVAAP